MNKQKSMDTNYNKQDFQELIEKYLDGKISLEEVKLLVNYYHSFKQDNDWVDELGPEDPIKHRMLINILEAIQDEEPQQSKVIRLFRSNVFKFSVAASILLFVFFNAVYNDDNLQKIKNPQTIVVNNDIKIGTDKATLTTEDGTTIVLEKGKSYTAKNLVSNGEELIYNKENKAKSEVVYNYLSIPRGGEFFLKLADGTQVWLNSESKLKYPVSFVEGETRKVELVYGEAYFTVSPSTAHKGAKFQVLTGLQEVEVIGTQFNIKAYKDEDLIYTTLVEGKVAVDIADKKEMLKPNQQLILNKSNKNRVIAEVDVYSETAWKKGLFAFQSKTLKEIMQVLSRWYDVDVVFQDKRLENIEFKGVLNKNQNIEEILTLIKKTKFINAYEIKEKKIIIKN
ncbi:FecR family protein [Flavobacterium saccharophilum]|uniref:FecR family protein n=1 Tax=Flavobacterium saccharophilum TaxID=29534 RepID=A0A1M7FTY5_9FLAO|nr:FecR domain-containing protein [Flavobacterium saccharophilum]SHM07268.1 FecR family protein [Flavobacterium saccharophilum]